jgi:hypothetical protein
MLSKRSFLVFSSYKILPVLALAVTLSPIAAHAHGFHTPKPQYYLAPIAGEHVTTPNKDVHVLEAPQTHPTVVNTGVNVNLLRNSFISRRTILNYPTRLI